MTSSADHARLGAFLAAETDTDAEAALVAIFDDVTEKLLVDSVRRGLSGSARGLSDAEDVASETRVRLIQRLWALRRDGGDPIEDFAAYVATTATRTCYAHLRARFPARTRFRNQVRYSVSRHPDTSLDSADGMWQCRSTLRLPASHRDAARSGQAGLHLVPTPGSLQQFLDAPSDFLASHRIDRSQALPHLIAAVLARLDAPIGLDRLVDALAAVLGIADARPVTPADESEGHALERVPDPAPDRLRELADREALEALWREVAALPVNQRAALLLNLRDPDGGAALHALPATGILTRPQLAQALDISAASLDELWDELPLDDLAIAARLGVTRQQVINLRKSARARLARRMHRNQPAAP